MKFSLSDIISQKLKLRKLSAQKSLSNTNLSTFSHDIRDHTLRIPIDARVLVNVRSKTFLQVSNNDTITVLRINLKTQQCYCQSSTGDRGFIPINALQIPNCLGSVYLYDTLRYIASKEEIMDQIIIKKVIPIFDLIQLLGVCGLLEKVMTYLFYREICGGSDKEKNISLRREKNTSLRGDNTQALIMSASIFNSTSAVNYRNALVYFCISWFRTNISEWSCYVLIPAIRALLNWMTLSLHMLPPELAILFRGIRIAEKAADVKVQSSFFFLRFICPTLSQPFLYSSNLNIQQNTATQLLELSKSLQIIANRVDPIEKQFAYPIREELARLYNDVDIYIEKLCDPLKIPTIIPSSSLETSALEVHNWLNNLK